MDQGGRLFLGDHRFQRGRGGLVDPGEVETGVEGGQKHRIMDVLDTVHWVGETYSCSIGTTWARGSAGADWASGTRVALDSLTTSESLVSLCTQGTFGL